MADKSAIEWTDATWNPVVGCSIDTPGCINCYAMGMAGRIEAMTAELRRQGKHGAPHYDGTTRKVKGKTVWTGKLALAPDHILTEPLSWKRPRRIFVNSMGDLFHEDAPDEWIDRVFAVMALCPQHTFQVLTKRSARMRRYLSDPATIRRVYELVCDMVIEGKLYVSLIVLGVDERQAPPAPRIYLDQWPLSNVWLGVSAEDQTRADQRIPDLLATPAAIRFVSAEPLIGPIDFTRITHRDPEQFKWLGYAPRLNALTGNYPLLEQTREPHPNRLDWIIVGGESGSDARPMHPAWARAIRDQCAAAGVAFFFKQWGEHRPLTNAEHGQACGATLIGSDPHDRDAYLLRVGKKRAGRLLDGVEHNDLPAMREVPFG